MLDNLHSDFAHLSELRQRGSWSFLLDCLLFDSGFQAVMLHRAASWFKRLGIPAIAPALARISVGITGVDINPRAEIGPGLVISHGNGLVIGGGVTIGARAHLHQQVTLGAPTPSRVGEVPVLGDDVVVGAGAKLIGRIHIGDRVFVGANALVSSDVPAGSKVLVEPATIRAPGLDA